MTRSLKENRDLSPRRVPDLSKFCKERGISKAQQWVGERIGLGWLRLSSALRVRTRGLDNPIVTANAPSPEGVRVDPLASDTGANRTILIEQGQPDIVCTITESPVESEQRLVKALKWLLDSTDDKLEVVSR